MPETNRIDALRDRLLTEQVRLSREKSFALAMIVVGEPTAGRSEVVNQLLEWLDPKHIKVHALDPDKPGAPTMHRYWVTLPRRGEIAIYFLGWYEDYLRDALFAKKGFAKRRAREVARIRQLESMLSQDQVRVLKINLRVARKLQRKRIEKLLSDKDTRWRVTRDDRWLAKHFDRVRKVTKQMVDDTDLPDARWHVVDGADADTRMLTAGALLLEEFEAGAKAAAAKPQITPPRMQVKPLKNPFSTSARHKPLDDEEYERELEELQGRLALLSRKKAFAKRSVVLAFEGMDAAGKGGAIRRLTAALDARRYQVLPISAPTTEELAHPYLWRFWKDIPKRGEFAIFDRSWYGRVLVERVRGFAAAADWRRAYEEINEFELQLTEAKVIVHKFWLSVGKNEQLKRLTARESDALKRYKVDTEDWANRKYYDAYQLAARDMIERTNSSYAPWTIVEANDKKHARIKVLRTVCEAIEGAVKK